MNGILNKLRSARYIWTIDLSQASFQKPLAKDSREIIALVSRIKNSTISRECCMGWRTFQRLLDKLIGPEMEPHAFTYLDDIVIVSSTFEEHLEWLKRVLNKLFAADLIVRILRSVNSENFVVHKII